MKVQITTSMLIAGKHCEKLDVIDLKDSLAEELISSKRAILYTEKPKPKRTKKPRNVNSN